MPLQGTKHSEAVAIDAPYFDTLADLDKYAETADWRKLDGVHDYVSSGGSHDSRGKLLVCHDYKGGYNESPTALSYTFNFWNYCDVFIYFSHHRVTLPPPGWINAAHRHGTKILGTLIFEHAASEPDCLRLLVGPLPSVTYGPARQAGSFTLPVSAHYARVLAELARQRGFDGYLLNFECPLLGGTEQARALATWVALLKTELERTVGSHAEISWYDSVIVNGQLRWQDRLNSLNLPFFLASTNLFTNYTWPAHYPGLTASYLTSLPRGLAPSKSLQDIYVGIDVWGRGSHGGGGFGAYKALAHIDPAHAGLSVALFGQAWTWESQQDEPGWSWSRWWMRERALWLGGEGIEDAPEVQLREGEAPCPHGPFEPIAAHFTAHAPPTPFCTTFSPGVGYGWFVRGKRVMQTQTGWTDVDKQGALGDELWPRPVCEPAAASASTEVRFADAWNGGSCVRVSVSPAAPGATVWVPVQRVRLTHEGAGEVRYEAKLVHKGTKCLIAVRGAFSIDPESTLEEPSAGWMESAISFSGSAGSEGAEVTVGLLVRAGSDMPSTAFTVDLGQLAVYPRPSSPSAHEVRVMWADFVRSPPPEEGSAVDTTVGVLTWGTGISLPAVNLALTSPEDINPAWTPADAPAWHERFLYFNVYVVPRGNGAVSLEDAVFVGTTGLAGREGRILVEREMLPVDVEGEGKKVRFYVQGVSARGTVVDWDKCVFVDCEL